MSHRMPQKSKSMRKRGRLLPSPAASSGYLLSPSSFELLQLSGLPPLTPLIHFSLFPPRVPIPLCPLFPRSPFGSVSAGFASRAFHLLFILDGSFIRHGSQCPTPLSS